MTIDVQKLASTIASKYTHRSAPLESVWTFTNRTLEDFANQHAALVLEQAASKFDDNPNAEMFRQDIAMELRAMKPTQEGL